jgi:hypothetical protein
MNQRVGAMDVMMKPAAEPAAARTRDDWVYVLVLVIAFLPLFAAAIVSRVAAPRAADPEGAAHRSLFVEAAADVRSAISIALMDS